MGIRRLFQGLLLCVLAAVLALAGGWFGIWQMADHLVFRSLYLTQTPVPDPGIRLIDIDYPAEAKQEQPLRYREALGSVLRQLAGLPMPPRAVLLDIWISANPTGEKALLDGIRALKVKGTSVYAAVHVIDRHGTSTSKFMESHHKLIYDALDGYGHTQLEYGFGVLKYDRELSLQLEEGEVRVPALPVRAVIEAQTADMLPPSLVIPLGADASFDRVTHRWRLATGKMDPAIPADVRANYVIIGSFDEDKINVLARPGPLLVAWAVSDLAAGKGSVAREPLNHPAALVALAVFSAVLAIGLFSLTFRVARLRVAPARWGELAGLLAFGIFLATSLVLLCAGGVVLLAGRVIPVAFPIVCAALGAAFSWRGARSWIAEEQVRRELTDGGEERVVQYDVFVSYSRDPAENKEWVKSKIVVPLAVLRHRDNTPYRIFFDEGDIKVGKRWKSQIDLALLGSRCFLPVYSESYFKRPYCREEFDVADQLQTEGRLRMFPVTRVKEVPERYWRKVQYIDARTNPEFMAELIAQIRGFVET